MLKSRRRGICVVLAGVILVASWGIFLAPTDPIDDNQGGEAELQDAVAFSWEISVGDEFVFNITASGINSTNSYLNPLVNTTIQVRITSLPNDTILSEEDFRNLVYSDKVDCMFSNGSEIPYPLKADISRFVARFFLPVGGWDFIDSLYPDSISDIAEEPGNEFINTHLSQFYDDAFYFGHIANIIDDFNDGNGWSGNISLTNGVPFSMEWWGFSFSSPDFYRWVLRLQLI